MIIKLAVGEKEEDKSFLEKTINSKPTNLDAKGDILVDGLNDLKVSYGGCCKPVKGDNIIGYISKGNGITIHRSNCHNICDISERIINVEWNINSDKKYVTNIVIYTDKKDNFLLEIINKTTSLNIGIKRVNTISTN